jgi:multidrug efflux system membrane fusion protein
MRRKRWLYVAAALAAVAAAWWAVRARTGAPRQAESQPARTVPVTVAAVARRDVPIYLDGLGAVVAYRTVTVRTQVDGRLEAVLFREGQTVHAGQVLAQIDPRPFQAQLHQAEGALARDQAQLRNARLNAERDRQLVAQKLIAPAQGDADVAAVGQLEGAVRVDEATIETARLNLDYARITSPTEGVTGIRAVDPGNVVHPADQNGLVVVTQLEPIAVIFTLPQDQLGPVSEALSRGPLQVDAFSRDGSTLLGSGQLELIDNQINQATSTIRLKAILPNPRHVLWPNQFVNARLLLETRRGALAMPATAVQRGPSGTYVYLVNADSTVAQRPVAIAATQADLALVASGLAEGDRVVVDGQNQLRPGARVAPREVGGRGEARPGGAPVARDGGQGSGAQQGTGGGGAR